MFRSAGNRRFVVRTALAATVVGLFVAPQLASASHGGDDDPLAQAQVSDDSTPDSIDDSVDDSTTPTTFADTTSPATTPDTTEDNSTPDSTPETTEDSSTPDTTEDSSTPTSIDDDDDRVPPIAPFTKTYATSGGSVTVTFDGSTLSLSNVAPAAGFSVERQEARGDRVRVRFESEDNRSEIEVGFHDGELREEVEED